MNDFATITERSALTFERDLPGPIERVWSYLTDPEKLAKWFDDASVANAVGGNVQFAMGVRGRITAYEPPNVLEYTWNEDERTACGPIDNSLVRWELTRNGDRVQLTLTHSRIPERALSTHGAGWHTFLERLAACAEDRELSPLMERFERLLPEYENYVGAVKA